MKGSRDRPQPTNTWDTLGQKHTHSKVMGKGSRVTSPANQADNTSTGAPWHRVQNPNYPSKQAELGEAQKKEGKGWSPTHVTKEAEVQTPGDPKTLREPAAGKTAYAAGPEEEDAARPLQPNPRSRPASWSQTC